MSSSTLYTIGTALGRAREGNRPVQVLVDGHWIGGLIAGLDGHGVVLDRDGDEHAVIKIDRIAAMRTGESSPGWGARRVFTAGTGTDGPDDPPAATLHLAR